MRRIVVGFSNGIGGMLALERGVEFALRFNSELVIAQICLHAQHKAALQHRIETALDSVLPPYRSPRRSLLKWRTAFASGDVAGALNAIAESVEADLLVIGSRRPSVRFAAALRAGIVARVLWGINSVPVFVERQGSSESINRILVLVSLNSGGEQVVLEATKLAREFMSDLYIAYVLETDLSLLENALPLPRLRRAFNEYRNLAEHRFNEFLEHLKPSLRGYPYTSIFTTGSTVDEVLRLVRRLKIDLLVVGVNKKRRLSESILGSAAEQIAIAAPVSVLGVPLVVEAPESLTETEPVSC